METTSRGINMEIFIGTKEIMEIFVNKNAGHQIGHEVFKKTATAVAEGFIEAAKVIGLKE